MAPDTLPTTMFTPESRLRTATKLAFTALVLGLLVALVGWRELAAALARARWPWLALMYIVVLVSFSVMAANLWLILNRAGVRLAFGRMLLANALANLYGLILPGDLMAGVSKWVVLSAATGDRPHVLSALVLNKVVLAIPPLLFGTAALAFENPFPRLPVAETAGAIAVGLAAGTVLALHPRTGEMLAARIRALTARLPAPPGNAAEKLLESFGAYRGFGWRDHLAVLSLAFFAFGLGIVSFLCATRALGLVVPIPTLVWISLALFLSRLLPITFNNLGVREGLLILALGTQAVAPALALGVGLLMFSNLVWIGLVGAACQLAIALGWVDAFADARMQRRSLELGDPG